MDSRSSENNRSYSEMLMDLLLLKGKDYDAFMEKMYDALTGEAQSALNSNDPVSEKKRALSTMISYFQAKEHYEKCAKLKEMSDSLKD